MRKGKEFILRHNIALWDVLINCHKEGVRPHGINDEMPNDFENFFSRYSNIKFVFFNGKLAADMFDYHVEWKKFKIEHSILPSFKQCDYKKTIDEKVKEWK